MTHNNQKFEKKEKKVDFIFQTFTISTILSPKFYVTTIYQKQRTKKIGKKTTKEAKKRKIIFSWK